MTNLWSTEQKNLLLLQMAAFTQEEMTEYGYSSRVNSVVARAAIDQADTIRERLSDNPTLGPNPFEVDRTTNVMGVTETVTWHNDRFVIMLDEENSDPEEDYGFELFIEGGAGEDFAAASEVIKGILAPLQGARRRRRNRKTKKASKKRRSTRRSLRA